jgi:hypothetical protein
LLNSWKFPGFFRPIYVEGLAAHRRLASTLTDLSAEDFEDIVSALARCDPVDEVQFLTLGWIIVEEFGFD